MNDLTVIVAVYNTAQYLPQCLDSIFRQSYKEFDLLLIDDCSTDGSGEICEKYKSKYVNYNVEVLHNEVNLGVSATWEKAVCHAKTEWIYVVDSDDLIHPELLKSAMNFIKSSMMGKTDILEVEQLYLTDKEIEEYSWTELENPRFMIKCGNLSLKEKKEISGGMGVGKNFIRRDLCLSIDYLEYKKKWPRRFFNDGLYSMLLFQKAEVIAIFEDVVYLHRDRINSTGRVLDRFDHLRDWVETDEEQYQILQQSGEYDLAVEGLCGLLNSISKLVYFIDKNKVNEKETRMRMIGSFNKYYGIVRRDKSIYKSNHIIQRLSWKIFNINSYLWVKTFGYMWFEYARTIHFK